MTSRETDTLGGELTSICIAEEFGGSGMPQVSVVIPTYNRAGILERSIRSVLGQTHHDLELIIVDDGSTDGTRDMVAQFHDMRVKYVQHETNHGCAAARNTGISTATGDYLAFNDSDDEWLPYKLERQMQILLAADARVGVVYSDMWMVWTARKGHREYCHAQRFVPEDGMIYDRTLVFPIDLRRIGLRFQTAVFRRECFEVVGLLDQELTALEDLEFFMRLSRHYQFSHVAEPLVTLFIAPGSLSGDAEKVARATEHIMSLYHQDIAKDEKLLVQYHVNVGLNLLLASRRKIAGRHIMEAVRMALRDASRHLLIGACKDLPQTCRYVVGKASSALKANRSLG